MRPFDANGVFLPVLRQDGLRRRAVRSAGITVSSQAVMFVVQLGGTFVLARILTPRDFGLVTLVTTFSLLLAGFGLNGFTEAVIQREKIDHRLASNLFWINLGIGTLLSAGFASAGVFLVHMFGDPRLDRVTIGMSVSVLFGSASVLHLALLKRAMQFTISSAADIAGRVISVALSIILACLGWSYWALVAGAIAQPAVVTAVAFWNCRWLPSFPRRAAGTAEVVGYAFHVYGRYIFSYATRNTDNLLVGWRFGSDALGFYKKAYDLFLLPTSQLIVPVSGVAISTLCKLTQDLAEYRLVFLRALTMLAFAGMGIGACLTIVGSDLMRVLLGPGWALSGKVFTYFGPGIGIMLVYNANGLIHLSIGSAKRWFRWGLIEFVVTVSFFVLSLRWGPVGLAVAWTASFWVLAIPAFWYAGKPIGLGVASVVAVVWRYILASVLAALGTVAAASHIPAFGLPLSSMAAAWHVVSYSVVFAMFYLLAVIVIHGGTTPVRQFVATILKAMPCTTSSPSTPAEVTEVPA
jgi:O-antigen/teichoic acid export membrane protein